MTTEPLPRSPGGSPAESRADRLDSWKDIAGYLQRDVSTVQRWEKREGMPVHRHVHEKQGSVYAYRSELDGWWRSRGPGLAQREPEPDASTSAPTLQAHRRLVVGVSLALALTLVIVLALTLGGTTAGVTPPEGSRGGERALVDREVYDLVMRARYLSVRTTDADNRTAITLLEHAIERDPAYAPAYAELASAYVTRLGYVTPDETRDLEQRAFSAAEKALSLDPNVPEAYLARGDLLWTHSHRFAHERAVQEFRRALHLKPDSDQGHRRIARVFVHVGFFDEALQHAATALTLNPSNHQALNSRAQALLWMGKDEEALAILQSIPGPVLPELVEANTVFALMRLGRREKAWSSLRGARGKHPSDPSGTLRGIEAMLLADTEPRKAEDLIAGVRQRKAGNPSHHAAYFAACALARMGKARESVEWLREAAGTGFPCYPLFARDPNLDPIRQDPHFKAFMGETQKASASLRRALFPAPK